MRAHEYVLAFAATCGVVAGLAVAAPARGAQWEPASARDQRTAVTEDLAPRFWCAVWRDAA